ncbi:reverse transcriptase domain-containing protein [Tanacetum coccineum]
MIEKTMKRYGVSHRFSTSYHPQTSGQVENTNRALKRILEKIVKDNPAIWSRKLDDALWAFRTTYKTPTGTTPYKLIYGKNCHLPFEIEHSAYWALKNYNPDLIVAGDLRIANMAIVPCDVGFGVLMSFVMLLQGGEVAKTVPQSVMGYCNEGPCELTELIIKDPAPLDGAHTPKSHKFEYIPGAVDYVSKWAEAQALPTNDARVVITFLKKLFRRFRMPKALITDRGTHFSNKIMEKIRKRYGVSHRLSTSYHPQTSGQDENTNRALKRILEKTVKDNPAIWSRKLDDALWAFCTAYKTSTGTTPYKPIYGKNYHLPFKIEHRAMGTLRIAILYLTLRRKMMF